MGDKTASGQPESLGSEAIHSESVSDNENDLTTGVLDSNPAAVTVEDFALPGDAIRAAEESDSDSSCSSYFSHSEDENDFLPQETEARPEEQRACIFEDRLER